MIILGIADSHESHACIIRDGQLVAAVAEERLSRLKADLGYPTRAVDEVLRLSGITADEVDHVALAGFEANMFLRLYKRDALFSIDDWVRQNRDYWKPKLLDGAALDDFDDWDMFRDLPKALDLENDPYFPALERLRRAPKSEWSAIAQDIRVQAAADQLGIARDKIAFYRHEDCHAAYGYFSSPYPRQTEAVFTIEGMGDDSTATVNTMTATGQINHLWKSPDVQLGRVYRMMTLLLGMKPLQHEYKVMGLAPYGTDYHGKATLELLRQLHKVQGYEISEERKLPDLYYSVRDALEGQRFDGLAWGLQAWTEELLTDWIEQGLDALDMRSIVLSGGVAQNIKAMKAVAELSNLDSLWVPPIAGDGSLAVGAAWLAQVALAPKTPIQPFPTVYLGNDCDRVSVEACLSAENVQKDGFTVLADATPEMAAGWLENGLVIARCAGRMEFGQRALGNRSILADPRRAEAVERINQKIKYRDFWMPFTPSVLDERVNEVIVNPKALISPFMTMAFDLAPAWHGKLPGVVHPADNTVRPQMLKPEHNPGYHALISAFETRTTVPAVLNTSFNLHGEPIANGPEDALHILRNSDLDGVLFDGMAVMRRTEPN